MKTNSIDGGKNDCHANRCLFPLVLSRPESETHLRVFGLDIAVVDRSNDSRQSLLLCDSTSDIISNLPADVINNIMIRLPIEDAARTTVLSKKWKLRWIYIPQIVIDFFNYRGSLENRNQRWFQICQILSLHRGPLHTFRLFAWVPVKYERCFIDQIMIFLSGKDIQKLTLSPASETRYMLPSYFFRCLQLTDLILINCEFRLPHRFIGFGKLTLLKILVVTFSADDFRAMISKCPLLEELHLQCAYTGHCLEIDAPNLKHLFFKKFSGSIIFKNVPVLSTVQIRDYNASPGHSPNIAMVCDCLPAIEYLNVDVAFLVDSSKGFIPESLPRMLSHLKFLELYAIDFNSSKVIQCALLLIRSSPKLQKLKIDLGKCSIADGAVEQLLKSLNRAEDSFDQLEEATLEDFSGTEPELEFLRLLLAKSLVLKKIVIKQPLVPTSCMRVVEILKAVTRFQRVSPKAEIVFFDHFEYL